MTSKTKARILVVEDDVTVRKTIAFLLESEGYDVSTAEDGFDALLHLQQALPDLILSDLNMQKCTGVDSPQRKRPQRQTLCGTDLYAMLAIVPIYR